MNKSSLKKTIVAMIFLAIIILSIVKVEAFGIAPSRKIIDYDPLGNNEYTITARIINSEAKDIKLEIIADGELSEYVTINNPELNIKSYESEKSFTYNINLPSDLEPGSRSVNIIATEVSTDSQNNNIGGYISLSHQLFVNVPYTGKHATGELSIAASDDNIITATLVMSNIGDEKISEIDATINIYNIDKKIIYTKKIPNLDDKTLLPKETLKIEDRFTLESKGEYNAELKINYDDKTFFREKEFSTGRYNIDIVETEVKNFKLGTIAKFDVGIDSEWNTEIDNVYTEIIIKDLNNNLIDTIRSDRTSLNPYSNSLSAYWDTKNIVSGTYKIELKVYAGNQIVTKEYYTQVGATEISLSNENIATEEIKLNKNNTILGISLITLVLIIGALFMYKNKKLYK